jgi:clan AA aspartic protease (TIGR02281 family)
MRWITLRHIVFRELGIRWHELIPLAALALMAGAGAAAVYLRYGDHSFRVVEDEHHHFIVTVRLEGRPFRCAVDTGADDVSLSKGVAEETGLRNLRFSGQVNTANGVSSVADAEVERIEIGPIVYTHFPVLVVSGLKVPECLVGNSWLNLQRYEISQGVLRIWPNGA